MRPLPELTAESSAFWTGGERGDLMIAFCDACARAIHPPQVVCPTCLSRSVTARAVAGTGTVYTCTVNHQPWVPDMQVPFAIAVVDVDGAPGIRVTAPVTGGDPAAVRIGQRMAIRFEPADGVWLPLWHRLGHDPDGEGA